MLRFMNPLTYRRQGRSPYVTPTCSLGATALLPMYSEVDRINLGVHREHIGRAKRSPGEGEAERPKLPDRTQWVNWNPTRERLATPGSEFCVVASDGGTKRKQPELRPCDRA